MQVNGNKKYHNEKHKAGSTLAGILLAIGLSGLAGCGGGGGGSGGEQVTPPPAADTTFSVTLESVAAIDRSSGGAVAVSGSPVDGATATLQP